MTGLGQRLQREMEIKCGVVSAHQKGDKSASNSFDHEQGVCFSP